MAVDVAAHRVPRRLLRRRGPLCQDNGVTARRPANARRVDRLPRRGDGRGARLRRRRTRLLGARAGVGPAAGAGGRTSSINKSSSKIGIKHRQ